MLYVAQFLKQNIMVIFRAVNERPTRHIAGNIRHESFQSFTCTGTAVRDYISSLPRQWLF